MTAQRILCTLMVALFTGLAGTSPAVEFPAKPAREHYYVDGGNLLQPADAQAIDQVAGKLLSEQQIPILVVTIPSLITYRAADMTVEQYAAALFNHWGIGSQDRNYGILLLVSVADRKARIELGAGWGRDHDSDAQYIMNLIIIPSFKTGDFSGGIRAGVEALDKMARGLGLPLPRVPIWFWAALIGGAILLVTMVVSLFRSGRQGWAWALLAVVFGLLFVILRSASKGGSGRSFRGGSSGGGGASGSW